MSRPRHVLPNVTYLITQRCTQRQFLLRPSQDITGFFAYCLGYAASRFGVAVHAVCVLSNHYHIVVTDVRGNLPEFMQWLDGTVARGLNAYHGRTENFWLSRTYSRVELLDAEAVFEKIVYTLANPVAAGLVSEGAQWPGLRSGTLRSEPQRIVVERPKFFFSEKGDLPERVELVIARPAALVSLEGAAFGTCVEDAVLEREAEIRAAFKEQGRGFLGPEAVQGQSPTHSAESQEPRGDLNPQVASRDKERRTWRLDWIRSFLVAYREALRQFVDGVRDVVFPAGTYGPRVHLGCVCAEPEWADLAPG